MAFIKQRALRRAMWFKVLDRVERAIINLAIRCVERVRSQKLTRIMTTIVNKLTDAMKSRFKRLIENVGRPLARKMSQIAKAWGNVSAVRWVEDSGFIQYLAVMQMITPMGQQ